MHSIYGPTIGDEVGLQPPTARNMLEKVTVAVWEHVQESVSKNGAEPPKCQKSFYSDDSVWARKADSPEIFL